MWKCSNTIWYGADKVALINQGSAKGKKILSKETIDTILSYREMLGVSTEEEIILRLQTAPDSVGTMDPGAFLFQ